MSHLKYDYQYRRPSLIRQLHNGYAKILVVHRSYSLRGTLVNGSGSCGHRSSSDCPWHARILNKLKWDTKTEVAMDRTQRNDYHPYCQSVCINQSPCQLTMAMIA